MTESNDARLPRETEQTRVLNLYAGIGGNRKLWENAEVTAVEIDEEIAQEYSRQFPNDEVVVADAHQFLLDHYDDGWDFIWASPPCQTHSKISYANWHSDDPQNANREPEYPDMRLYQEIILLRKMFDGDWVVENVNPYYGELLEAQRAGRHLFWSNFHISDFETPEKGFNFSSGTMSDKQAMEDWLGIELTQTIYIRESHDPAQVLRNAVHPQLGQHVFASRDNSRQQTLSSAGGVVDA